MSDAGKTTHFCNKCKTEKSIDQFYKAAWCTGGYRPTCNDCREERMLMIRYGVTKEWFLEQSKNGCNICGRTRETRTKLKGSMESYRLCVDHDHTSGKTRGVLCNSCNTVLGKYFDNQENFNKFLEYKRTRS